MDLSNASVWWIAAGVAVAAELATGTFYLLMIALGLGAGALAAQFGSTQPMQLLVAAVVGGGATALWHWRASRAPGRRATAQDRDVNPDIGERVQRARVGQRRPAQVRLPRLDLGGTPVVGAPAPSATGRAVVAPSKRSRLVGGSQARARLSLNWRPHEPPSSRAWALVPLVVAAIFIFQTFKIAPQQNAWAVDGLGSMTWHARAGLEFVIPFHRARRQGIP
jgi:membrane protein implicated in regulation of membrane protease activity